MSRTIIIRLAMTAMFAAVALSSGGGILLAEDWTNGYFLDVINRSNYTGTLFLQQQNGNLQEIERLPSFIRVKRLYGFFNEERKQRIVITYNKEGDAIQSTTDITPSVLNLPKYMSGRRILLTNEHFEKQISPTMEKVMALDGQWQVGPYIRNPVAELQLSHLFYRNTLKGAITDNKTGNKYHVDGKVSGNGYTFFFYEDKQGDRQLVCTLKLEPLPEEKGDFRGNAVIRWFDEKKKKYLSRNIPLTVRVIYPRQFIEFSLSRK